MMRDYAELITRLKQSDDNCNAECCECSGECLSSGCNIFSEAADAIEELLDELTTIRKQLPRWISVEERLPEINDDVLVCNMDYGKTELGFATDAVWDGDNFLSAWNRASAIHCVTHWMPLPKAPASPKEVE